MRRHTVWLAAAVLCAVGLARADDVGSARLDLVVPDVPAATTIGLAASKVQHPTTLKDFTLAALSGATENGKMASGFGIEVSPIDLALGTRKDAPILEQLARSVRLSAASSTSTGSGATTAAAAFGARFGRIYNPRTDEHLLRCIADALPNPIDPIALALKIGHPPTPNELRAANDAANARLKQLGGVDFSICRAAYQANHLANISVEGGLAFDWKGTSTLFSDLQPDKLSLWVIGTYGWPSFEATADADKNAEEQREALVTLDQAKQKLEEARAKNSASLEPLEAAVTVAQAALDGARERARPIKDKAADAVGWEPQAFARYDLMHALHGLDGQKNVFIAGRLPLRAQTWTVFLEVGHQFTDVTNVSGTGKDTTPAGIGGDVRLGDGTWLGVYFSADLNSGQLLSIANLKWSFGDKSPF